MNIFVIDKATKRHIGTIDFLVAKGDRIILSPIEGQSVECIVDCLLYYPEQHGLLIFVTIVEPYYYKMIDEIRWEKCNVQN